MLISFTIADGNVNRIIECFGIDYEKMIIKDGKRILNPQTKTQYAKEQIKQMVIKKVKDFEYQSQVSKISIQEIK